MKSFLVLGDYNVSSCQQLFTIKYEVISVSLTILTCLFLRKSKEKKNLHSFSLIYFTLLFPLYYSSQLILWSTIPQAYFTYIHVHINQSSGINSASISTLCVKWCYIIKSKSKNSSWSLGSKIKIQWFLIFEIKLDHLRVKFESGPKVSCFRNKGFERKYLINYIWLFDTLKLLKLQRFKN